MLDKEKSKYLSRFGWTEDRISEIPEYIDIKSTPENVLRIIKNLNRLKIEDVDGYSREFKVHPAHIRDFDEEVIECVEDTGLNFEFYPLGAMSEQSGVLVVDKHGRFFLMGDELLFYGDNLDEFFDVVIFSERSCISIRENGETFYCYNNKDTGVNFEVGSGWQGDKSRLTKKYILENEKKR